MNCYFIETITESNIIFDPITNNNEFIISTTSNLMKGTN